MREALGQFIARRRVEKSITRENLSRVTSKGHSENSDRASMTAPSTSRQFQRRGIPLAILGSLMNIRDQVGVSSAKPNRVALRSDVKAEMKSGMKTAREDEENEAPGGSGGGRKKKVVLEPVTPDELKQMENIVSAVIDPALIGYHLTTPGLRKMFDTVQSKMFQSNSRKALMNFPDEWIAGFLQRNFGEDYKHLFRMGKIPIDVKIVAIDKGDPLYNNIRKMLTYIITTRDGSSKVFTTFKEECLYFNSQDLAENDDDAGNCSPGNDSGISFSLDDSGGSTPGTAYDSSSDSPVESEPEETATDEESQPPTPKEVDSDQELKLVPDIDIMDVTLEERHSSDDEMLEPICEVTDISSDEEPAEDVGVPIAEIIPQRDSRISCPVPEVITLDDSDEEQVPSHSIEPFGADVDFEKLFNAVDKWVTPSS